MTRKWSGFGSELGRSMIEMLGVLAIVGVLSIGGISGFQKAMNKHKINQVTEEFSQFTNEMLRYSKDWRRIFIDGGRRTMVLSSELDFFVSAKWERRGSWLYDEMGNSIIVRLGKDWIGRLTLNITYRFNSSQDKKSKIDLCMAYFDRLKPYADSVWGMQVWRHASDNSSNSLFVYGNAYCDGKTKKCLRDLTLDEMRERCSVFQSDDKGNNFEIYFLL